MRIFRAWTTIPKKHTCIAYPHSEILCVPHRGDAAGRIRVRCEFHAGAAAAGTAVQSCVCGACHAAAAVYGSTVCQFSLEIVREAGLRLPKPIGHSVSLVAALIVGDAAVSAGIVGTPVVIVAAMTAICTFVVPSLYEPITVLLHPVYIGRRPPGAFGYRYAAVLYAAGDVRYEFFRYPVYSAHRAGQQCILEGRPAAAQLAYAGAGRFFH